MKDTPRWAIVVVATLLVIGLMAFARGRDHRHGDDVGALGLGDPSKVIVVEAGGTMADTSSGQQDVAPG